MVEADFALIWMLVKFFELRCSLVIVCLILGKLRSSFDVGMSVVVAGA